MALVLSIIHCGALLNLNLKQGNKQWSSAMKGHVRKGALCLSVTVNRVSHVPLLETKQLLRPFWI